MRSVILSTDANARTALNIPTVYEKGTQLLYLDQLIADFEANIATAHAESWWQTYFSENVLYFQPSYIRKIDKMNIKVRDLSSRICRRDLATSTSSRANVLTRRILMGVKTM